jgi:peptide/nickel transport system ATP-binding protein/Fe3+-transporting ATPase
MLEAEHIHFRYAADHPWLLKDVSLNIAPGQIMGLTGHSGRGKTTLARIISGYLKPVRGGIRVDGRRLPGKGYCPVQMIFQHPETALNPRWRIIETLNEAGPVSEDFRRSLHIDPAWHDRRPLELSGGQLQRVAIARILRPETRYIVADEITTMLDAVTQAGIWQMLLSFVKKNQVGVLVISHDANLMKRVCDGVKHIDDI